MKLYLVVWKEKVIDHQEIIAKIEIMNFSKWEEMSIKLKEINQLTKSNKKNGRTN